MVNLRVLSSGLLAVAACEAVCGQPNAQSMKLDIEPQPVEDAINSWAAQTGFQVLFPNVSDDSTQSVPPIKGVYAPEDALRVLLAATNLKYELVDARTVAIAEDTSSSRRQTRLAEGAPAEDISTSAQRKRDASEQHGVLQEVIVTATKREERLQDVPVSIAVIGSQDIERRGLIGMEDYLRSIPGVNEIDRGPADNSIVIRGITTNPEFQNSSTGTTVSTYFEETPITGAAGLAAGGIDVRPVDLERIELLRGPQGTAYGSSSLSGALRLIPAKPNLERFNVKVAGSYSDTVGSGSENSMIQGVVNVPVVENKFAFRAVGYRFDEGGFYSNIAGSDPATIATAEAYGLGDFVRGYQQDHVGGIISTGGRLAALWKPTDKLNVSLNYLTQKIQQDGNAEADTGRYEQTRMPIAPAGRLRGEAGEVSDTNIDLLSFVLNYDLGWSALTSVASWVDSGSAFNKDYSGIFGFPSSGTIFNDFKSFTAETRLASHLDGRFQFLGGLFYEDVDSPFSNTVRWPGAPTPSPLFDTNPISIASVSSKTDQRAVFGEVSYDLSQALTATGGGRYFKYRKDSSGLLEGGLFGIPFGTGVPDVQSGSDDGSIFKANLSYKPMKDGLLYAGWSQGFRLGPPDGTGVPSAFCDTNSDGLIDGTGVSVESTKHVDSDLLDNYEVGGKFKLFEGRMVLDAAIYHISWQGLPIRVEVASDSRCAYTGNAGAATSDGIEFQANLAVVNGLQVDVGVGYTNAEISKDQPAEGWHKGDRLPGSPKISANLAAQYVFDVAGHAAFVRADSFYTGKFYGDILQSPELAAGDYVKVDARAGVAFANLSFELFVHNLTNRDDFAWRGTIPGGAYGGGDAFGFRLQPRTIGVHLGYSFQ